ncbi:histidine kinase [Longispora sp. K20-0274]|uniref:sensor histidine kinase n=1 Tax=Longispora sp. K20-0274 TaxID=3088255 RepID=UPI00399BC6F5
MRPPTRDIWLPLVVGCLQLAVWPLGPWLAGGTVHAAEVIGAGLPVTLALVALGFRRTAPVPALAVVLLMLMIAAAAATPASPDIGDQHLIIVAGIDLIALYSVAVHRPASTSALAALATLAAQVVTQLVIFHGGTIGAIGVLFSASSYSLAWALGRVRRRWRARREAVATRLASTRADHAYAAAEERQRLARELHDVSAHHLSGIVVHAQAAQRLADRQPELAAQALSFAATTGQETLESLRRLVDVMDVEPEPAPDGEPSTLRAVGELAAGFARLGHPVTLEVEGERGDVPAEVAAAGHRIVQEALTNALRYAGGAPVRIRLGYQPGLVVITVDDDGRGGPQPAAGLGSGRGLPGMRDRARELGGHLQAGPAPGGGWTVRAMLPYAEGSRPKSADVAWWRRMGDAQVVDVLLAVLAGAWPALIAYGAAAQPTASPMAPGLASPAILTLVLALHGAPLLWRRTEPWLALAAVLAVDGLWLGLLLSEILPPSGFWLFLMAALSEGLVVYAIGAYARRGWLSWLSALVGGFAIGLSIAAVGHKLDDSHDGPRALIVFCLLFGGALSAGLLLFAWLPGHFVGRRRRHALRRDTESLDAATAAVVGAAREERDRIAHGLRGSVFTHTTRVVERAGTGDAAALSEVVAEARAALGAMRELLGVLRSGPEGVDGSPAPTAAALPGLCARRGVQLAVEGEPRRLPVEVDVSAYRLVELALTPTEHAARAEATVVYGSRHLRVHILGAPALAWRVAELAERVDATGGRLTVKTAESGCDIDAWYPAPA